ncbi:MAG: hypothetical protein AAFR61_10515 [Bacteroidota bacterium]
MESAPKVLPTSKELQPIKVIEKFHDSTYFGFLSWMTATDDHIFISDHHENHILMLDHDLSFIRTLGRKGRGPGELNGPNFLATTEDELWIENAGNRRFEIFSLSGTYQRSWIPPQQPGGFGIDGPFAVDKQGNFWVCNRYGEEPLVQISSLTQMVHRFPTQPARDEQFFRSGGLFLSSSNHLLLVKGMDGKLEKYNLDGRLLESMDLSFIPSVRRVLNHVLHNLKKESYGGELEVFASILAPVAYFKNQLFIWSANLPEEDIFTDKEGRQNDLFVFEVHPKLTLKQHFVLQMSDPDDVAQPTVQAACVFSHRQKTYVLVSSYNTELLYLYELPQTLPLSK